MGLLVGIWILITAVNIYIESYDVLMDGSIDSESKKNILKIIKKNKMIKRIGSFYYSPNLSRYGFSLVPSP